FHEKYLIAWFKPAWHWLFPARNLLTDPEPGSCAAIICWAGRYSARPNRRRGERSCAKRSSATSSAEVLRRICSNPEPIFARCSCCGGHSDARTTVICTHVISGGGALGARSPMGGM